MLNYKDSGLVSTPQTKDTHDWWVETVTFHYSTATLIATQAVVHRTGGCQRARNIGQWQGGRGAEHGEERTRLWKEGRRWKGVKVGL